MPYDHSGTTPRALWIFRRVLMTAVVLLLVSCSSPAQSANTDTPAPAKTTATTKPTTPSRATVTPTARQTLDALHAPYPCNHLIYGKGDTGFFTDLPYPPSGGLASYRPIVQANCAVYLTQFDAAVQQVAQNSGSASSVAVSASAAAAASAAVRSQAAADSLAAAQAVNNLAKQGKYALTGSHLIGPEIQPGTWRSVGDKVTSCYWEISDAQGEIIDNNFISVAPQFTIDIPASAAGFTNTGCDFERIG